MATVRGRNTTPDTSRPRLDSLTLNRVPRHRKLTLGASHKMWWPLVSLQTRWCARFARGVTSQKKGRGFVAQAPSSHCSTHHRAPRELAGCATIVCGPRHGESLSRASSGSPAARGSRPAGEPVARAHHIRRGSASQFGHVVAGARTWPHVALSSLARKLARLAQCHGCVQSPARVGYSLRAGTARGRPRQKSDSGTMASTVFLVL